MKKILFRFFIIYLVMASSVLNGQTPNWKQFTNGQEINGIAVVNETIWAATNGGLVKINPGSQETTFYNSANSELPANYVFDVVAGPEGVIWAATREAIIEINNSNFRVYDYKDYQALRGISAINVSQDGVIWVGTEKLISFDGNTWNQFSAEIPGNINNIEFEGKDSVWVAISGSTANSGIALFDGSDWITYTPLNSDLPVGGGFISFYNFIIDDRGDKWISVAFSDKVVILSGNNFSVPNNLPSGYKSGIQYANGDIYLLVDSSLFRYEDNSWENILPDNFNIKASNTWAVEVYENDLLIGNQDGLFQVNENESKLIETSNSPLERHNSKLTLDNKKEVVILSGNKLLQYVSGSWKEDVMPVGNGIFGIEAGSNNKVYIATNNGLYVKTNNEIEHHTVLNSNISSDVLFDLYFDSDILWMATRNGLCKLEGSSFTTYNKTRNNWVRNVQANDNFLYITAGESFTFTQVWKIDKNNPDTANWIALVDDQTPFANEFIQNIFLSNSDELIVNADYNFYSYKDNSWSQIQNAASAEASDVAYEDSVLWIASLSSGLLKYDGKSWEVFTDSTSGLASNNLENIVVDSEGNKWISSMGAISIFNEKGVSLSIEKRKKESKDTGFLVYPNPTKSSFTVNVSGINAERLYPFG